MGTARSEPPTIGPAGPRVIGGGELRAALPMAVAVRALQDALRDGLDPESAPARSVVPVEHGQLLLMPAESRHYTGVKVVSVAPANPDRGLPRIQGDYQLFDAATLTPLARLDGVALTAVRTAAVSAAAVDLLAPATAARLVVFGTGPQARGHIEALRAVRPIEHVTVVARDQERLAAFVRDIGRAVPADAGTPEAVASADLVACCTTARSPLFDGSLLRPATTVVAVGSHEPDAREVDAATVRASTVVVEAHSAALREAGDVIHPVRSGEVPADALFTLADLARGTVPLEPDRPRLFKSVGMAWEDLVLAGATYEAVTGGDVAG